MKKHSLVGITSALGAVLWVFGPISHVVSVTGNNLWGIFISCYRSTLFFFSFSNLILLRSYFIFSNYGNSALMKDVKVKFKFFLFLFWFLSIFISISCFLFLLSCFRLTNLQLTIGFPGLFWEHCTSSLWGGLARVLSLLFCFCFFCRSTALEGKWEQKIFQDCEDQSVSSCLWLVFTMGKMIPEIPHP